MSSRYVKIFAVTLLAASLSGQQTWLVSCGGGPGVHFTDLPEAVAAAAPGDVIWVFGDAAWPCPAFQGYEAVVIDKPLTILGANGNSNTQGYYWQSGTYVLGMIEIRDIEMGERVTLCGIGIGSPGLFFASGPPFGIDAYDCAGEILLEDVSVWSDSNGGATLRLHDCESVILHNCNMRLGGEPADIVDSTVLFTNSVIRHSAPFAFGGNQYTFMQTAPGAQLTNSTLTLVASEIRGASALNLPGEFQSRTGVLLDGSVLRVGPWSEVLGGNPGVTSYREVTGGGASLIYVDPQGAVPFPPVSATQPQPVTEPMPATAYDAAFPNAEFQYLIAGPPGGYGILAVGDWQSQPTATPLGDLFLVPSTATIVACTSLDPVTGFRFGNLTVPAGVPSGYPFALQSVVLGDAGTMQLTLPTPMVLGWQTGLSPY